jgi:hypothetical protein
MITKRNISIRVLIVLLILDILWSGAITGTCAGFFGGSYRCSPLEALFGFNSVLIIPIIAVLLSLIAWPLRKFKFKKPWTKTN